MRAYVGVARWISFRLEEAADLLGRLAWKMRLCPKCGRPVLTSPPCVEELREDPATVMHGETTSIGTRVRRWIKDEEQENGHGF